VRKVGFLESAWSDYIAVFYRVIPISIRDRFLTRKAVFIALGILGVEACLATVAYWIWFRQS